MGRPNKLTPAATERLRTLLTQGVTHKVIAAELGLSKFTVCRWATRNGFDRAKGAGRPRTRGAA